LSLSLPLKEIAAGIALCSSCAFMLPVATPPNAIVFSANKFSVVTMVKVGLVLNLITVLLSVGLVFFLID
jgi:sodium-dependent dicarboxylate transporter 2/3/5